MSQSNHAFMSTLPPRKQQHPHLHFQLLGQLVGCAGGQHPFRYGSHALCDLTHGLAFTYPQPDGPIPAQVTCNMHIVLLYQSHGPELQNIALLKIFG